MNNNFIEVLLLVKYPLIGLFLIFVILSFYWMPIFNFFNLKPYFNVQRTHKNEVSRLGGLVIYLYFWIIYFLDFTQDSLFLNLLISSIPFVLISFKEDMFHNTTPKNRLIAMVISCLIFFYINPIYFPVIEIPYIGKIISLYPISIIFFTFSILVVMNGMNFIDGMNGLCGFTSSVILIVLIFLSNTYYDDQTIKLSYMYLAPMLIFLIFNFPFGKLFFGDMGAYFYGYLISILIINFFGRHENLLSWMAVLILFYPCMELLFSFIRKIKSNTNPFNPDNRHLHSIIFQNFLKYKYSKEKANFFSTLALLFFWIYPVSIKFIVLDDIYSILGLLFIAFISYLIFYKYFKP